MYVNLYTWIYISIYSTCMCTYVFICKYISNEKAKQAHVHIHIYYRSMYMFENICKLICKDFYMYIHKHIHSLERSQHQPSIRVEWVLLILVSCPSHCTSKVAWESLQTLEPLKFTNRPIKLQPSCVWASREISSRWDVIVSWRLVTIDLLPHIVGWFPWSLMILRVFNA